MSQATLAPELLNFAASATETSATPAVRRPSFFAIRSNLLTLVATGAVAIAGAACCARLSDSIVDSNMRAVAAAAAVPPAEYYQYISSPEFQDDLATAATSEGSANAAN